MRSGNQARPWLAVGSLAQRELVRFYRQRSRIIGTLATPLLFWVFLGAGLGSAFPALETPGGRGYLEYFYPGIVLLTILFTSIFANISLIEDRHEGFLQAVLVAPLPSWVLVAGKVLGGTALACLQGAIFLAAAPLAGFALSAATVAGAFSAIAVSSLALSALGFAFAWKLDSVQGFHGVMNVVLMPMWLLSGAFFPVEKAPLWLKPVMYANPLVYGYVALREALYDGAGSWLSFGPSLLITAAFALLFFLIAGRVAGKRTEASA